jgi:glucose/arabinose dehydrogenase
MKYALRLITFALVACIVLVGLLYVFRRPLLQRLGVAFAWGDPGVAEVQLPPGFTMNVYAQGLSTPRFMAVGPQGMLFVAERGANRVVGLPDRDGDGRADETLVVADGLDSPTSLAFDGATLYIGETTKVTRLTLGADLRPARRDVIIIDLSPGGAHSTRTVLLGADGRLYVAAGSSCNVCDEADPHRAAVWVYEADGRGGRLFARGLRNAVGLALNPWTGEVWATNNGRDFLGDDLPPETVYVLQDGRDYGWPRCHAGVLIDPNFGAPGACNGVEQPVVEMQAHTAPLGLAFYSADRFPPEYRGLFIALHGSWNRSVPVGYKVVHVPLAAGRVAGPVQDFAAGWLRPDGSSWGRPVGVTIAADGSLLVSDDKGGFIYRITAPP